MEGVSKLVREGKLVGVTLNTDTHLGLTEERENVVKLEKEKKMPVLWRPDLTLILTPLRSKIWEPMQSYEKRAPERKASGNADRYRLCDDMRGCGNLW